MSSSSPVICHECWKPGQNHYDACQHVKDVAAKVRESSAVLAERGSLDLGCTAAQAEGIVRRTRNEIARVIREGK